MLTALALTAAVHATEIGTSKKFGIGLASGSQAGALTGKFYVSEPAGFAVYVGTSGWYNGLRINYEREFYPVDSWGWAQLDLYWLVGVDVGLWTYYGKNPMVFGAGGGVGADMQFHDVPLSVFLDIGVGLYPINAYDELDRFAGFGVFAPRGAFGGRWYF